MFCVKPGIRKPKSTTEAPFAMSRLAFNVVGKSIFSVKVWFFIFLQNRRRRWPFVINYGGIFFQNFTLFERESKKDFLIYLSSETVSNGNWCWGDIEAGPINPVSEIKLDAVGSTNENGGKFMI